MKTANWEGMKEKAMTMNSTATKEVMEDTTMDWRAVNGSGALSTVMLRTVLLPPKKL